MTYALIQTKEHFLEVFPELEQYCNIPKARLALDVETFGKDKTQVPKPTLNKDGTYNGYIRTIQLGYDAAWERNPFGNRQYIIDAWKIGYDFLAPYLKRILYKVQVIGQNLKYEYQFLRVHMDIRLRNMRDTMLISQIQNAGDKIHHGLGDLYGRYLDAGWFTSRTKKTFDEYSEFKERHQTIDWEEPEFTADQLQYAADDVEFVFAILDKQLEKVDQWHQQYEGSFPSGRGMAHVILLECRCIPSYAMKELRGIKVDAEYHEKVVINYLQIKAEEAIKNIGFTRSVLVNKNNGLRGKKRIVWEEWEEQPLNLRSPAQLKLKINELLKEIDSGLDLETTREDDIRDLINKYSLPLKDGEDRAQLPQDVIEKLNWILQYKKATSLLSKFGEKFLKLMSDRGYIHPSWYQIGTDELAVDSGRSSCRKPNMMQIPSRGDLFVTQRDQFDKAVDGINVMHFFKRSFVAPDGYVFLDGDYSQEEPCIAADFCNETNLIAKFNSGKVDMHAEVGKSLCGLDYLPQKGTFERDYIGKTAGLSLLYGIHYKSLSEFMYTKTNGKVKWTEEQAKAAYDRFFEDFPGFKAKMLEVSHKMQQKAEDCGFTLAPFKKDRRPFAVAFTYLGRPRKFCLKHPEQTRKQDFQLARAYKEPVIDPKTKQQQLDKDGKPVFTYWNAYRERMSSASREGFNHTIQGTAADILKEAIANIHDEFEEAGFDQTEGIIAVIHDEILVQVKIEHIDQATSIMQRCMKDAASKFIKKVPINVDIHSGFDWASAKEPPKSIPVKVG